MSADPSALADLLLEVATTPLARLDPEPLLAAICPELAAALDVAGCAAFRLDEPSGRARLVGSSGTASRQLAGVALREDTGGPAMEAIRTGRPVLVSDLRAAGGSELAAAAARVGLHATAALPLRNEDVPTGCLQLFGTEPGSLNQRDVAAAEPLASVLGTAFGNAALYRQAASLVVHLSTALDSQLPVEQAKGLLAERYQVDLEDAARMLRGFARRSRSTLNEAARTLLDEAGQLVAVPGQRHESEPLSTR